MESISWLETYLLNYPGAVFIVSHDRYFLDKVVTKVIEIEAGQTRVYSGNYSAYALKKAQLRDAQYKAYLNQQRDIKHQEAVIAKLKSFNREKSIKRAERPWKALPRGVHRFRLTPVVPARYASGPGAQEVFQSSVHGPAFFHGFPHA